MNNREIRETIRKHYGSIVTEESSCCGSDSSCCSSDSSCCKSQAEIQEQSAGKNTGYTQDEIASAPEDSNFGLGCGNPLALASLKEGDVVIDLGSGAGFDCFLAAKRVGEKGSVIGVDMTPAMVEKARENTRKGGYTNVEFRLGEIEHLPAADASVDLVISNCVVNLSTDKSGVFKETLRVLKPGGKLIVSDIVLNKELTEDIRQSLEAYAGCVAGALLKKDYIEIIGEAGFKEIHIANCDVRSGGKYDGTSGSIASITVTAEKPVNGK